MARPDAWFPKRLDGEGFTLFLVHPELEVPFEAFVRFRDGAWSDLAAKSDSRIHDAGLQSELDCGPETHNWDRVQPDRAQDDGRYIVHSPQDEIVGLLRVRRVSSDRAVYANVLYRRGQDRHGVSADAVLRRVLGWLRKAGIRDVTTGDVMGPRFANHAMRCGFSQDDHGALHCRL